MVHYLKKLKSIYKKIEKNLLNLFMPSLPIPKSRQAFTLTSNNITTTFDGGNNQINFSNTYPISDKMQLVILIN